jgi:hypothetical protein
MMSPCIGLSSRGSRATALGDGESGCALGVVGVDVVVVAGDGAASGTVVLGTQALIASTQDKLSAAVIVFRNMATLGM